jgi:hypothetical protein
MQRLVALLEALVNFLNLCSLLIRQIKIAPERAERSKSFSRTSGPLRTSRPTTSRSKSIRRRPTRKTTLSRRSRPARLLRPDYGSGG